MTVADIKRGIADGSLVRNPDGSVRPTSLREQLGLSVVRRMDRGRGIKAQDILQREGVRKLAFRHLNNGGCNACYNGDSAYLSYKEGRELRCFAPDGCGGCNNRRAK